MFAAPEKIIEALKLEPNQIVADLGAGSGAFTIAAAKALAGTGKVYAVDVQKDLLTRLENTVREAHLSNVSCLWGDLEKSGGTKLRDQTADVVILSNVLFQAPDKEGAISEAKRILRPNGRILVIDWSASFKNMGPTPEQVFPEVEARKLLETLGFSFVSVVDAGSFHYGLLFRKGLYYNPKIAEQTQ